MKIRLTIYLLSAIIIASSFIPVPTKVENSLSYYTDYYSDLSGINLADKNLTIYFEELEAPTVGQCQIYKNIFGKITRRDIKIDSKTWVTHSYKQKVLLVLHELEHCVNLKEHSTSKLPDKCPATLMNPYLLEENCLSLHYDHYLQEIIRYRSPL